MLLFFFTAVMAGQFSLYNNNNYNNSRQYCNIVLVTCNKKSTMTGTSDNNANINTLPAASAPAATSAGATTTKEVADVLEERLIDSEYKIWKKNTPYL